MVAGETARSSLLGCRRSAKRKRALLESNPPRNTRPGTHRKMTPRVPGSPPGTRFCLVPFDRFPHASENSGGAGAGPRRVFPAIPLGAGWVLIVAILADCFKLLGEQDSWLFPKGKLLEEGKSDCSTCFPIAELEGIRVGERNNQRLDSQGPVFRPLGH